MSTNRLQRVAICAPCMQALEYLSRNIGNAKTTPHPLVGTSFPNYSVKSIDRHSALAGKRTSHHGPWVRVCSRCEYAATSHDMYACLFLWTSLTRKPNSKAPACRHNHHQSSAPLKSAFQYIASARSTAYQIFPQHAVHHSFPVFTFSPQNGKILQRLSTSSGCVPRQGRMAKSCYNPRSNQG